MSFSEGDLDVKVSDEELGEFLSELFDESENDKHCVHILRSREVVVHGEVKRLRLSEYVAADLFDDIETTLANIGASGGVTGDGVLLKNTSTESIETALFKILTFPDIAKWTLLKNWIDTIDITLDDWLRLWKIVDSSRPGKTASNKECTTVFRFTGTCGRKICLTKSCKGVADAFHDSMHGFEYFTTPHRGTMGLIEFKFPGGKNVSTARKKICLLLDEKDRVTFCHDQISGKHIDIDACLQSIRCASPDDVALPITPLGGMDEILLKEDQVAVDIEDANIVKEPPLKKQRSDASRSREGSRAEDYLKEQAEKAKDEAKAAKEKAKAAKEKEKAAKQEAQLLREQLAALKVARETPQAALQDIGIKIEDSDPPDMTSAERERYFRELDEEHERYEQALDQREIEQFGMETHQKMKRRRLSQYDATHIETFREFRNTYRTMREKRDIQIELRVWLPVFLFAGYFAACEYGAEYLHEQGILPALGSPQLRGSDELLIYIGILLCAGIMLVIFAFSNPTVCDWFYGLVITPATRLCFASNQGYASMIIIVLLCSQKIKWLLALEFVGVVVFVVMAPLANRFIFMARLLLTVVFYQNRLINHLDQRTPTIFLSVWRELILTLMFVVHFVFDKLELFFCGCTGHE